MAVKKKRVTDYTKSLLPKTRKAQFLDILRNRYNLFILIGFIILLSSVPLLIVLFFKDSYLIAYESIGQINELIGIKNLFALFMIPCFMLIIFSINCFSVIFKNLIWGEPIFFKYDIKKSIKQNWKSSLIIGFFVGFFYCFENIISNLYSNSNLVRIILLSINFAIIYPLLFNSLFITIYYQNKFVVTIKSALILYIKEFPKIMIIYASVYIISFIKYIPYPILKIIILIIILFIYVPISLLWCFLTEISIFDNKINKIQYKEIYKKGLYIEDK